MVWQWTPYTPLFAATAASLLGFATYLLFSERGELLSDVSLGGLLLLAGGSWVAAYTVKLSVATLPAKVLLTQVEYLAMLALPLLWFAYVLQYVGRTDWLSWRVFGPLVGIAVGIDVAVLTDGTHHLLYREYGLSQVGSFVVFDPVYGPLFAVFLGFVYTLLGASLLFLATAAPHARGVFRWQIAMLFLFALIPGAAGLLFVSGANPIPGLNIVALSFSVTAVGGTISYVRFEWLDITPIARDHAFESMTEAVVVLDGERRIVDVNTPAEELLHDSVGMSVGEPAADAFPELADRLDALDPVDPDSEVQAEITRGTDGRRRVIDVHMSPISAAAGDATGYTLLLHDVTARREAERRAEARQRKLEDLHRVARNLTAARTRESVFQRAVDGGNEVFDADICRLAVAEDDRLVPQTSSGDEPIESYDSQPANVGIAGLTYQSGETIAVDDLGRTRSVSATVDSNPYLPDGTGTTPDSGPEGTYRSLLSAPVGDVGVIQALADDSGAFTDSDREALELLATHIETAVERTAAESELKTERDRLEGFASVVSHDLRNPLNVARGRIELLRADAPAEHVDPIDRSLSRMEDIITDLLTLAREGDAVGDVDAVELRACVEDAWRTVDTGSSMLHCDDGLGEVTADAGRLQQLLENLLRNAMEHGSTSDRAARDDVAEHGSAGSQAPPDDAVDPFDPAVAVTVGHLDDEPGFYVADDGPGIPPEERESIFEHGYTTEQDGTGLGLTIVDRIADAHGWTVTATDADAGGARFEIRTEP